MNKLFFFQKIINSLTGNVQSLEKSLEETNNAINDAPGAMQSHSDTTRSQLTVLENTTKQALIEKATELESLKGFVVKDYPNMEESRLGSIVKVKKGDNSIENYFLLPAGSGVKVEHEGEKVICITPTSPLGKELIGKKKGQKFSWNLGLKKTDMEILDME